jgi:hypothetical protein
MKFDSRERCVTKLTHAWEKPPIDDAGAGSGAFLQHGSQRRTNKWSLKRERCVSRGADLRSPSPCWSCQYRRLPGQLRCAAVLFEPHSLRSYLKSFKLKRLNSFMR